MKKALVIFSFWVALLGCKKDDQTVVTGFVRENLTNKGIEGVRIGIFKISIGSFGSSYILIKEVYSDANGKFEICTNEPAEIILASKKGYFEDPSFTSRKISTNTNNELDIILYPACKVNFNLRNINNRRTICISTSNAKARDCEFDYNSECYYSYPKDTMATCFIWGGEPAKIEYSYFQDGSATPIEYDTTVFFPANGEVNLNFTF